MYKAFVSSTYDDLMAHRAEVIDTLKSAGIQVDPMEHWQADRATPSEFSAGGLADCHLCILLVAFRRGTVPAGQQRSIVQLEYDEARRRRIDVLPFLLVDDAPVGPGGWPTRFDERSYDLEITAWRTQLRQSHGVGDFGVGPKSLRIEAALARWVVQRDADRSRLLRRSRWSAALVLTLLVTVTTAWVSHEVATPAERSAWHGRFLAFHDPIVFNSARDGRYAIVRVLPDRGALISTTNLGQEIGSTRESFDMLVNNAQYIRTSQQENFRELIRRGVHVRLILWDYTARGNGYEAFHAATNIDLEETRSGSRLMRDYLLGLRKEIAAHPGDFHGTLDFRWNPKPLLYTMWIRDWRAGGDPNELGHLGIHFYRGESHWPAFRTSSVDGLALIDNMHEEFLAAWAASTPDVQLPPERQ